MLGGFIEKEFINSFCFDKFEVFFNLNLNKTIVLNIKTIFVNFAYF